ncbi:putative gpi ethanolamine phosphate transferase protein [Phaeoacremonium minimum UCRPA7]|uniref:Putative gpi ethanolamine phosphate transferase protein n=1 Tax=Phaeoacremonium minimum (strain UCR-PA7) TaxID=1286976 RepID=R8BSK9_PHAM7|nr:putative gpi ethanolamine phosphate transferase protein [Phaeoacremonium minimum UCRPA7]EOO02285.1 putative gpi ethanolamine phosphate transferase protein [Phaeoacremonium minimum UCRPA7]
MPPPDPRAKLRSKPPATDYKSIAAQFAAAKRAKELEEANRKADDPFDEQQKSSVAQRQREALEARRKKSYERRWAWTVGFWVWMLCIHVVGIAYFTSGFLLTRLVLDEKSSCAVSPVEGSENIIPAWKGRGTVEGGCWHPKTFERAVVVLIDALRYDFTVPVEDDAEFHNAFPFLYETAVNKPNHAFLRPFIADPPTSTLQRLKGLTTGTLPVLLDLGSSFAGTAIDEDNLLIQLRDAGKRIVHLGDDTWDALFPDYFLGNLSRSYDSFNVWDLHTVDNGVLEHIFPLMKSGRANEWDVLIGHLLGVDHAGHRYGPAHPAMRSKLQQMDGFIRELVETIDDDTLLIVMGDHGMDSKGDHGGESEDEVEAALWMYSSKPVFGRTNPEFVTPPETAKMRPVNQIDLVPTLALLLGTPIPYNNLGGPIEEAFIGRSGDAWANLAAASRVTAAGINRYQASYYAARGMEQNLVSGSPADLYNTAEKGLKDDPKGKSLALAHTAFSAYQHENLSVGKSLWARFDLRAMVMGVSIMAAGVVVLLLYVARDDEDDFADLDDLELDIAEKKLEIEAPWQLVIPFAVFAILPSIIKAYYLPTRSYEGLAPTWIGYVLRTGLFMSAAYWTLNSADDGNWIPGLPEGTLKNIRVYIAQVVLALALVAGTTAFIWAPPCISIFTTSNNNWAQVTVLGYGNANGARYLLLPINIMGACILLSKPVGGGAMALMMWQVMSLVEILDLNSLTTETIGPVMLGILGNYYFFKTGHQAALSTIQWDAAFIPLFTIRYPWSPIIIVLNTFAGQILAAVSVPLISLWKVGPKRKGVLESVSRSLGVFIAYFAVEALATMAWSGWLRRHLMLYRVFMPRFMTAAILLLIVDFIGIAATLTGVRSNTMAISEVFGWAD